MKEEQSSEMAGRLGSGRELSTGKLWLFRAVIVLVLLLGLEGLARTYRALVPPAEGVGYGYPPNLFTWDDACEYRCTPGFRGFFESARYGDVPISINSDGYRDREFSRTKTPGVERVVFLGDSITFGSGVPAEVRFSDLVGSELAPVGSAYESLNLAINDYTFHHYLQLVRKKVPRYDPEIVVIGFCLNDLKPKETSGPRKNVRSPDGSYVGKHLLPDYGNEFSTREASAFIGLTSELRTRWKNRDHWRIWSRMIEEKWEDETLVENLRRDMIALRDDLRRQARRLVVVVLPELTDVRESDRFGGPRKTVITMLESLGIEHLDPHPIFAAESDPEGLFLFGDTAHYSGRGHQLAARAIRAQLDTRSVARGSQNDERVQ